MENKERKLMLCRCSYGSFPNDKNYPSVIIQGKWFKGFGFSPGDQVVVSNPEPDTLVMKVHKRSKEINRERKRAA